MKKEYTFEVIWMLQMAIRAFETNPKGRTELEKNAIEMVRESTRILSEVVMDKLAVNNSEARTSYHPV